jgi:hypothetical protein
MGTVDRAIGVVGAVLDVLELSCSVAKAPAAMSAATINTTGPATRHLLTRGQGLWESCARSAGLGGGRVASSGVPGPISSGG